MTARPFSLRQLLALLSVVWLALGAPAQAQDYPPRPQGPVYDGANIISPATEAALDRRLRDYNRETGRALIVATVPSLNGAPIESYATGLFGYWGIGGAKRDQGLLLLVAPNEKRVRIEVGYGLHPYFGGIMAGRVIRDDITPRFKEGDFDAGIVAGIDAITAHLAKSPEEAAAIEEAARTAEAQRGDGDFPFGVLIWGGLILFFVILPMLGRVRGHRYRGRGSGAAGAVGEVLLWTAINAAMNSGDGDGGGWGGGGGGGGFGGFGGGMSGGGGASGSW